MTLEAELVQRLASPRTRLHAMRSLVGGVTATELRDVRLTPEAFGALIEGLDDPNPKVRWWCIQLLDHVGDERVLEPLERALSDPVPRVRRNAAHALGCLACKPNMTEPLPATALDTLERLAARDSNPKVRAEAAHALRCRRT